MLFVALQEYRSRQLWPGTLGGRGIGMAPPFKGYHKKVKESLILCEYLNLPEIRGIQPAPP
jgi:hypothetical protein